jgi:polyketide cyclase/dehydrase/lipid transport protein
MDDLVVINRPIQEVFAFVTDHSNDKLWKPFVTESRQILSGPIGVGTRFEIVTVAGGYRRSGEVEILEYEPCSSFAYKGHDEIFPFVGRLWFSTVSSGTHIHGQVEFQTQGLWKLLAPFPLMFFRSQTKRTFARLKQILESIDG